MVIFIRAVLVGAHRYVGPPDGPAFSPRKPRCDDCGYPIVGIPLDTKCPECGLPVRDSLSGGRRRPTPWHRFQFRPAGIRELLRMQDSVIRGNDLFRRIPVQSGMNTARHFWWVTLILFAAFILVAFRIMQSMAPMWSELYFATFRFALPVVLLPFALQSAVMSAACLRYQVQYAIRDYRVSAIVCYYASPLIWPFIMVAVTSLPILTDPVRSILLDTPFTLARLNLNGLHLAIACLVITGLAALLFWWIRLGAAMRAVRFANV